MHNNTNSESIKNRYLSNKGLDNFHAISLTDLYRIYYFDNNFKDRTNKIYGGHRAKRDERIIATQSVMLA